MLGTEIFDTPFPIFFNPRDYVIFLDIINKVHGDYEFHFLLPAANILYEENLYGIVHIIFYESY